MLSSKLQLTHLEVGSSLDAQGGSVGLEQNHLAESKTFRRMASRQPKEELSLMLDNEQKRHPPPFTSFYSL